MLYLLAVLFGDIYRTLVAEQEIKLLLGQFSLQLGSFMETQQSPNRSFICEDAT